MSGDILPLPELKQERTCDRLLQVHPYAEGGFAIKAPGAGHIADVVANEHVLALGPLPAQRVLAVLAVPRTDTQASLAQRGNVRRHAILERLVPRRLSEGYTGAKQHTRRQLLCAFRAFLSPIDLDLFAKWSSCSSRFQSGRTGWRYTGRIQGGTGIVPHLHAKSRAKGMYGDLPLSGIEVLEK